MMMAKPKTKGKQKPKPLPALDLEDSESEEEGSEDSDVVRAAETIRRHEEAKAARKRKEKLYGDYTREVLSQMIHD